MVPSFIEYAAYIFFLLLLEVLKILSKCFQIPILGKLGTKINYSRNKPTSIEPT